MNSLMELDRKSLLSLVERAQAVHNKLNDEIESSISFCKVCSEHGRYCDVAETSFAERERLIAIRNSLNEVENMLVYLQKLQSWQLIDQQAAFTCLEKSRIYLMEQSTGYQGRALDVVNELNACFGNEKTALSSNLKYKKIVSPSVYNGKRSINSFLIACIRFHLDPWKWKKTVGIAAKLIMVSASISSALRFYRSTQKNCSSHRRILSFIDSTDAGVNNLPTIPNRLPDIFSGRG